jgi:hypothetical protein
MWKGPYLVSEARGQLVLALQHVNNQRDQQVVSVQHVKPCQLNEGLANFTQQLRDQQAGDTDNGEDIEIEAILNNQPQGERRRQFLIQYAGHTAQYNSWVDEEDLQADELLPRYLHDQ